MSEVLKMLRWLSDTEHASFLHFLQQHPEACRTIDLDELRAALQSAEARRWTEMRQRLVRNHQWVL